MSDLIGREIALILCPDDNDEREIYYFVGKLIASDGDLLALDRGPKHPLFPFARDWCDLVKKATPQQADELGAPYYVALPLQPLSEDADPSELIPTGVKLPSDDSEGTEN